MPRSYEWPLFLRSFPVCTLPPLSTIHIVTFHTSLMHVICKFPTASELLLSLFSWTGINQEVYYANPGTSVGAATSGQAFYALPTSSGSDGSSAFRSPSPVYGPPAHLVTSGGVSRSSSVSTVQENTGPQTSLAAYSTPTATTVVGLASGSSSVAGVSPSGIQEHSVTTYAPSLPSRLSEFPSVSTAAAGDFSSAGTGNVQPVIQVSHASSYTFPPVAAEVVRYSNFAGSTYPESQGNTGVNFSPVHSYSVPAVSYSGSVESSIAGALSSAAQANAADSFISTSSYAVPSRAPGGAESSSFAGSSIQESTGYAEISFSPATSYSAPETTQGVAATSSFSGHISSAVQQNLGDNFAPGASHGTPAATSAALSSAQGHSGGPSLVPLAAQHSYGIPRLQ